MKRLVFATNNSHKLSEARKILTGKIEILSLSDISCHAEIPETADTLEGNALIKARYIKEHFGYDCFADDTGLIVEALNGRPGVYSARYAGEPSNAHKNMEKLMSEMQGKTHRRASFTTCVALIIDKEEQIFTGEIKGEILQSPHGTAGFGYDPLFVPDGYNKSFAELGDEIKNHISHRARAMEQLATFITANMAD
ncbi:MAG: non-canonical purine NTP diphosphatase [Bacteroidales bacterium]